MHEEAFVTLNGNPGHIGVPHYDTSALKVNPVTAPDLPATGILTMNAETLILIAPCSLLLDAALQILVAPLLNARLKGILAFLTCLPAVVSVAGLEA